MKQRGCAALETITVGVGKASDVQMTRVAAINCRLPSTKISTATNKGSAAVDTLSHEDGKDSTHKED